MPETKGRQTPQRKAIQRVFFEASRPLTIQEVLDSARGYAPNIGIATIYRSVKRLTEDDWLRSVEMPGEGVRYERSELTHHHHFSCKECKLVFDIHSTLENFSISLPKGFTLETHEIFLYGICARCT